MLLLRRLWRRGLGVASRMYSRIVMMKSVFHLDVKNTDVHDFIRKGSIFYR
jgi:hypothetical protein